MMGIHSFLPWVRRDAAARPNQAVQDATIRHIEIEATPSDRSFALWFVALCVMCWAALIALAVIVDPLAAYGTGVVPPLVPNDREMKATAYRQLSPRPQALIIGSSRVMMLPPACLEQTLGMPAYNFGLNSGRVEDYVAVLRFAQAQGPVRRILIGVDPEALHNGIGMDDRLVKSRQLSPYLDADLKPSWWARIYANATDALTWETFTGSLRALKYAFLGGRPDALYTFDETGLIHEAEHERLVAAGRFDQAPLIRASVTEYDVRYATFTALSESRKARLEAFVEQAHAAGVQVDAFIPPLHPELVLATANTTIAARTRETEELLSGFERRGLVHFARFPTLDSFGGDPALFFDGAHMMKSNAVRLISAIYHAPTCAVQ